MFCYQSDENRTVFIYLESKKQVFPKKITGNQRVGSTVGEIIRENGMESSKGEPRLWKKFPRIVLDKYDLFSNYILWDNEVLDLILET